MGSSGCGHSDPKEGTKALSGFTLCPLPIRFAQVCEALGSPTGTAGRIRFVVEVLENEPLESQLVAFLAPEEAKTEYYQRRYQPSIEGMVALTQSNESSLSQTATHQSSLKPR